MKLNNLKIYYILIFTNNLWFITANWLNYWLKYMTLKEVGIIDAIAFLIGILLEFPSGLVSDRLGRKQSLFLSQSFQLLGSLLITFASNLNEIGLGFIIFQVGVAFYSGTIESYGYEAGLSEGKDYTQVLIKSSFYSNIGFLSSLIIGGYLYIYNENYPNIMFSLNFIIGFIILFFSKETLKYRNDSEEIKYSSFLNFYTLLILNVLMIFVFAFDYGFLKLYLLDKFSNISIHHWYIFASTGCSILISSLLLPKVVCINKALITCYLALLIGVVLTFYTLIPLFFVLSFLAVFTYQISLKYINERIPNLKRAGTISMFNLFYKLPYVLIALILGYNLA